jgi:hypothetical protein
MKAGNKEAEMNKKNFMDILCIDKELRAIFSGVILSAVALASVAITAGIWYL